MTRMLYNIINIVIWIILFSINQIYLINSDTATTVSHGASKAAIQIAIFSWNSGHANINEKWQIMEENDMLPPELDGTRTDEIDLLVMCIQEDDYSLFKHGSNPETIHSLRTKYGSSKFEYRRKTMAGRSLGTSSAYVYLNEKYFESKRFVIDFQWEASTTTTKIGKGFINVEIKDSLNPTLNVMNVACAHLDAHADSIARANSIKKFFEKYTRKNAFAVMAGDYNYRLQIDTASPIYNDVLTNGIDFMNDEFETIFKNLRIRCNKINQWFHSYKLLPFGKKSEINKVTSIGSIIKSIKNMTNLNHHKNGKTSSLIDESKLKSAPFYYHKEIENVTPIDDSVNRFALNYGYLDRACHSRNHKGVKLIKEQSYQILPPKGANIEAARNVMYEIGSDHVAHFHTFYLKSSTSLPVRRLIE